jgi:hypothetical protein
LPRLLSSLAALVWLTAPGVARAEPDLYHRPRFDVAVGFGGSVDRGAPNPHPDRAVTSFFFSLGLGDGLFGVDLRSFGNGATKAQVNRVSYDLVGVVRPLAAFGDRPGYRFRVARTASFDVGPSFERVSLASDAGWRAGALLGAHVDLPIGPADATKELRLRLGVRRMFGTATDVTSYAISDTTGELYAQIAFVF